MRIDSVPVVGIDTETGGLDPKNHELYEVALRYIDLRLERPIGRVELTIKNTRPVPPEASAIHHLTETHLQAGIDRETAGVWLSRLIPAHSVIFAHNAEFDRSFLPELNGWLWLCTKRLAAHVWPDAPAYRNQILRYWLGGENWLSPDENAQAHRAAVDITVTEHILREALDDLWARFTAGTAESTREALALGASATRDGGFGAEELIAYADSPFRVKTWPFGKYYGEPLESAPSDYIKWAITSDRCVDDPDLVWSLGEVLQSCRASA